MALLCQCVIRAVLMCTGTITVYGKSDRAVQVSSSNEVVLSADGQGATAFKLVACLESDAVSEPLRLTCVSLMDADCPDRYVRHSGYFLHVHKRNRTKNLPLFKADSSFIVHPNKFHQGKYALESVNYRGHYISSQADGRLKIVLEDNIIDLHNASFRVFDFITPSTYHYHRSVCWLQKVLNIYRSSMLLLFCFLTRSLIFYIANNSSQQ